MVKQYKIETFTDVQVLHEQAKACIESVTVYDKSHSCANGKSILGLMTLSYVEPVSVECELESFFQRLPLQEVAIDKNGE